MTWPKGAPKPEPDDMVAVLMTERMARRFEKACLGRHTAGESQLTGPLLFSDDDVPTYIIGITDAEAQRREVGELPTTQPPNQGESDG